MPGMEPEMSPARRGVFRRRIVWLAGGLLVLGLCAAIRYCWGPELLTAGPPAAAAPTAPAASPNAANPPLDVMAVVNQEKISRADLANEALQHHGVEVLSSLINKYVVVQQCRQYNITISPEEVQEEIQSVAKSFSLPVDQYLKMLETERSITPKQYADDIIWPTIALRKLAANQVQPTQEDIDRAYETQFGEAIQARLIVSKTREDADQLHALAMQNPEEFGNLAKQYSIDPSAAAKGMIHPIRRHLGDRGLEDAAYSLQPGQISAVIPVMNQFVIIKCDGRIPARKVSMEEVYQPLYEACREKKLRQVADGLFRALKEQAKVVEVYGNPQLSSQYPGVAAMINGQPLTVAQLAEECVVRHGKTVLEKTINRRLIEQECRRQGIEVTEDEMNAEIAKAAVDMGHVNNDGTPDIRSWLDFVVNKEGTSLEVYRHDSVWPSAALKKLAVGKVEITDEDLQKGYQSNYGPRVRCRAIVFNQLRKAQEVFDLARKTPTVENFGNLAEEYSIEGTSRALRGEIPPIRRHSGSPQVEAEAFSLHPGEISSIIQVGDKFILLFCEGQTKPVETEYEKVRQYIFEDVYRKKLYLAMTREFQRLQDAAQIDNYLAGTSQTPANNRPPLANVRDPSVVPVSNLVTPANSGSPAPMRK